MLLSLFLSLLLGSLKHASLFLLDVKQLPTTVEVDACLVLGDHHSRSICNVVENIDPVAVDAAGRVRRRGSNSGTSRLRRGRLGLLLCGTRKDGGRRSVHVASTRNDCNDLLLLLAIQCVGMVCWMIETSFVDVSAIGLEKSDSMILRFFMR